MTLYTLFECSRAAARLPAPAPAWLLALALPMLMAAGGSAPASFTDETAAWRAHRLESLRAESGWLSLVGLYWLHEGENRFGADPKNDLVLPAESAPPLAGSFFLEGGAVRVVSRPEAKLTLAGAPISAHANLVGDDKPNPDQLRLGDLTMFVIRRGERVGIRAKSPNSPARTGFKGLSYFPASERYRVTARLVRAPSPRQIRIPTIIGTVENMTVPGTLVFTLDGHELRLDPVLESEGATQLFIIFRDGTASSETYPAGRFLYATPAADGTVVLDFNQAFNPPCAFTRFATCPLPPRQNILPLRIEAGEKRYGDHH